MSFLTIIIPLKDWETERLVLLLSSIEYLKKYHDVEIIIVISGKSPEPVFLENNISTEKVKFIFSEPKGIYNAFNLGVKNADGNWLMFFGGDDLLLPSMKELLTKLNSENLFYDAVVCNVAFGNRGLFKPFKSRYGLIFRNWCQQGVLYNKKVFDVHQFDETYPIQADHKFNIEIASKSNLKIKYDETIVSYFNTSGISQSINDVAFRSDMPAIVAANFGPFWSYVSILRRMMGTIKRQLAS